MVQAVARDLLCEAMNRLDKAGYHIVMTVHDEVVIEVPNDKGDLDKVFTIMNDNPSWFKDFPIACDGYICQFYKKE